MKGLSKKELYSYLNAYEKLAKDWEESDEESGEYQKIVGRTEMLKELIDDLDRRDKKNGL